MLEWLLSHTLESAALAVVVGTACLVLRRRPAARHALWLIVLAKLLTPPLVHWPWSLSVPGPIPTAVVAPAPEEKASVAGPAAGDAPAAEEVRFVAPRPRPAPAAPFAPVSAPPRRAAPAVVWRTWLPDAVVWTWFAGGCCFALLQITRIVRLARRLSRGLPAPPWLTARTADAARSLNVPTPRLVVLPGAASPMVCALGAVRLIWPAALEERLTPEGVQAVLLHELAHLRRRDHLVGWILLAAGCVWWWHPLFWWVRRRVMREAELACDAWVVAELPEARKDYAEALLEVSKGPLPTPAPVLGALSERRELERRLIMVLRAKSPARLSWAGLIGVGMVGLLALPAWSLGGDPPKTPAGPTTAGPSVSSRPVTEEPGPNASAPAAARLPGAGEELTQDVAVPARAPAPDASDKTIQALELQIKALQKQLNDLRASEAARGFGTLGSNGQGGLAGSVALDFGTATSGGAPGAEELTLSRVTYKLPAGHAAATASFLRDHVGASVLETRADGDNLVVTTTPDTQKVIRTLVSLIQSKPPVATPLPEDTYLPFTTPDNLPPSPSLTPQPLTEPVAAPTAGPMKP
jgi:beta-lactamase regulating signal transducer with metallopeptidase domain